MNPFVIIEFCKIYFHALGIYYAVEWVLFWNISSMFLVWLSIYLRFKLDNY